jgi:hypothetical protein
MQHPNSGTRFTFFPTITVLHPSQSLSWLYTQIYALVDGRLIFHHGQVQMSVRRQIYPSFMTRKPPSHLTSWTEFFGTLYRGFLKPTNPGLSPKISKVMVFLDMVATSFCYCFTFRVAFLHIVVVQLNWQPQSFLGVADPQHNCPFCDV